MITDAEKHQHWKYVRVRSAAAGCEARSVFKKARKPNYSRSYGRNLYQPAKSIVKRCTSGKRKKSWRIFSPEIIISSGIKRIYAVWRKPWRAVKATTKRMSLVMIMNVSREIEALLERWEMLYFVFSHWKRNVVCRRRPSLGDESVCEIALLPWRRYRINKETINQRNIAALAAHFPWKCYDRNVEENIMSSEMKAVGERRRQKAAWSISADLHVRTQWKCIMRIAEV